MCPFSNVTEVGAKDTFNFFLLQLCINIECVFGMLVHRFGTLCKPTLMNSSLDRKTFWIFLFASCMSIALKKEKIFVHHIRKMSHLLSQRVASIFLGPQLDQLDSNAS